MNVLADVPPVLPWCHRRHRRVGGSQVQTGNSPSCRRWACTSATSSNKPRAFPTHLDSQAVVCLRAGVSQTLGCNMSNTAPPCPQHTQTQRNRRRQREAELFLAKLRNSRGEKKNPYMQYYIFSRNGAESIFSTLERERKLLGYWEQKMEASRRVLLIAWPPAAGLAVSSSMCFKMAGDARKRKLNL